MKVLAVALRHNPYPSEIYNFLNDNTDIQVELDAHKFWCPDLFDFDIIHIHWPELLISGINKQSIYNYEKNLKSELFTLNEVLRKWKKKGKVYYTVHNLFNHNNHSPFLELAYQTIYANTDVFVHLGQASIKLLQGRYAAAAEKQNVLIPHNMNEVYLNNTDRIASRKKFGLKSKDKVVLIFGDLRTQKEKDFVLNVFKNIRVKNKKLLIARWKSNHNVLVLQVEKLKFAMQNIVIGEVNTLVKDEDIQYYFKAADVLLCPRNNSLNSGLIALSTAFATQVVGPKIGNIKECLNELGAEGFEADDVSGAVKALEKVFENDEGNQKGKEMNEFAKKNWSVAQIAQMHQELYLKDKL